MGTSESISSRFSRVGDQGFQKEDKPTDVGHIKEGYISVVPLTWKQEDTEQIPVVESILSKCLIHKA